MKHQKVNLKRKRYLIAIFTEEWVQREIERFRRIEALELDKPNHEFSNAARALTAYVCLSFIALDALPGKDRIRVMVEAETLCSRFGYSFIPKELTVTECPTKKLSDCNLVFVNENTGGRITCKCECHLRNNYSNS